MTIKQERLKLTCQSLHMIHLSFLLSLASSIHIRRQKRISISESLSSFARLFVHPTANTFRSIELCSSYRDFSTVQPEKSYKSPTDISTMSFAAKLHHILSSPEYSSAIAWEPHGRAFRVLIPRQLEKQKILSRYFGHNQYSKFLSDLRNHGLKSLTTGRYKGCYYHEVRSSQSSRLGY